MDVQQVGHADEDCEPGQNDRQVKEQNPQGRQGGRYEEIARQRKQAERDGDGGQSTPGNGTQ